MIAWHPLVWKWTMKKMRTSNDTRICRKCHIDFPLTTFRYTNKANNKRHHICRDCRQLHRKFLREAQQNYKSILDQQGNVCGICGIASDEDNGKLIIDHNHETMSVRGVICSYCNKGLGFFFDSPTYLAMAIEYLVKHDGITS